MSSSHPPKFASARSTGLHLPRGLPMTCRVPELTLWLQSTAGRFRLAQAIHSVQRPTGSQYTRLPNRSSPASIRLPAPGLQSFFLGDYTSPRYLFAPCAVNNLACGRSRAMVRGSADSAGCPLSFGTTLDVRGLKVSDPPGGNRKKVAPAVAFFDLCR